MTNLIVTSPSSYYDLYKNDDVTDWEEIVPLYIDNQFKCFLNLFEDTLISTQPRETNLNIRTVKKKNPTEVTTFIPYVNSDCISHE